MIHRRQEGRASRRRAGYGLVELAMAVALLALAMVVTVKAVAWVGAERRTADRRQWAAQAAAGVMERLAADPFQAATSERARALAAETAAGAVLPGAEWEAEVVEAKAPGPAGKRARLALRWQSRAGDWLPPVRLTSWLYPRRDPS